MRGTRVTLAPGIYQDQFGISVIAAVGTHPNKLTSKELRFDLDTPRATLVAAWHREKMKLQEQLQKAGGRAVRGTLATDVVAYFKTAKLSKQRQQERAHQLKWWCVDQKLGGRRRSTLVPTELTQALNSLHGTAPSTRNHYRTALSNLWTVLDGKNAPNPFRDVPKDKEPDAARRDQPYELIQCLLAKLRDRGAKKDTLSRTKAWLCVLAYAPVTPAQLLLVRRGDIDWTESTLAAPGRHKGGGTKGKRKPLTAEALDAFRGFDAAGCWDAEGRVPHTPSRSSRWRTFRQALKAAIAELRVTRPDLDLTRADEMTVKDLRHSFLTEVLRATKNLDITAEFGDHLEKTTTLRYVQGAMSEVLQTAGIAVASAFAARPAYVPPAAEFHPRVPFLPTAKSGKTRKSLVKTGSQGSVPQRGKDGTLKRKIAI